MDIDERRGPETVSVVGSMPPTRPARDAAEEEIAGMLVAIEANYRREGSGYGSRFEGERLEVVQARAVIRHLDEAGRAVGAPREPMCGWPEGGPLVGR